MNEAGLKLTAYFGERRRSGDEFLADALLHLYERHRIHTSVLLRGADGFGSDDRLHTDRLLSSSESLPAVSIAIDTQERVEGALDEIRQLARGALMTIERAALAWGPGLLQAPLPADPRELAKLTLYGGRAVRSGGQAGYVAAVERLAASDVAGATVLLAVDGTLRGERRRARFFARNAGVPLMLIALGPAHTLRGALPELRELLDEPVATVERVQICKLAGIALAEPHGLPQPDRTGLPSWLKLTVHVEEHATHEGRPVHVELLRRLREAGAAGATMLRGVRGFYADRHPFADRLLSLRRNVPVLVIVVDTPARMRELWPVVDEATAEHGLVTSELVPISFTAH